MLYEYAYQKRHQGVIGDDTRANVYARKSAQEK